jgi:two-component sensor histidine kinase
MAAEAVSGALKMGTTLNAEWRVVGRDGSKRWVMSRGQPVRNTEGTILRFIGIVMDITQRKNMENELRRSLDEKVSLLQEVHHRVKNNLQIVASLLDLQSSRTQASDARFALQETQNRVRSIALLHEALYRSDNFASTNFSAYVDELCSQLFGAFGISTNRIQLQNLVPRIGMPLEQAVPCGLIINELVSNALKHGYPAERRGTVTVELFPSERRTLTLRVADDGVGLSKNVNPSQARTLGLQLISNLADQLRGRLCIESGKSAGVVCTIVFPDSETFRGNGEL